jgi:hypothetical protein
MIRAVQIWLILAACAGLSLTAIPSQANASSLQSSYLQADARPLDFISAPSPGSLFTAYRNEQQTRVAARHLDLPVGDSLSWLYRGELVKPFAGCRAERGLRQPQGGRSPPQLFPFV